jgi:hypothetical protein
MLSHAIYESDEPGQDYEVLLFLVPHRGSRGSRGDLCAVKSVEYFLGPAWKDTVFRSEDGATSFGVSVHAYGFGFLCVARIDFVDGERFTTYRYVDLPARKRRRVA